MSWSMSIYGHSETVTKDELETAAKAAFETLEAAGANGGSLSGQTGQSESVSLSFTRKAGEAEPGAEA